LTIIALQVFKGFPNWVNNLNCLKAISTTIDYSSLSSLQVFNNPLDIELENEPKKMKHGQNLS
jgi:hypothetical protein